MSEYLVEAGHYYTCNGPSNLTLKMWEIGKTIAKEHDAPMALFVDNYHGDQAYIADGEVFLPPETQHAVMALLQDSADHVFYESDIVKIAPTVAERLIEEKIAEEKKDGLFASGIRLGTYVGGMLMPTCVFLDYVLLEQKVEIAPNQITVLPDAYASQQNQLQKLITVAPINWLASYEPKLISPLDKKGRGSR